MLPLIPLMLGTSALGTVMGAFEANSANRTNSDIALMNYYQQQQARQDAINESRKQQQEAKLGTTDAAGNRTYFVPGQGWVTELTDDQRALLEGTEAEQLRQLTQGGARAERMDARANVMRNDQGVMADAYMDELRGARRPDQEALRQLLLARGMESRNAAADAAGEAVARKGIRGGGGFNAAEVAQGARGASDASAMRQAGIDAQLQAMGESDRQYAQQRDQASSLYDYFSRGSTTGARAPQGYMPTGPSTRSSGSADQMILNSMRDAPNAEYMSPNNAWSDALVGLGDLAGSYNMMQSNTALNDAIRERYGRNTGNF